MEASPHTCDGDATDTPSRLSGSNAAAASSMPYDSDAALRLDNQLCFPLYAAARKVMSAYTPLLKLLGITYTQYITLMVLWEQDGVPVGELCRRLHLDNGTLTPMLKKMEKQGLITRQRDAKDERKVHVFLTDDGRAMKAKVRDVPAKVGSCIGIDERDARELYRILYKILNG